MLLKNLRCVLQITLEPIPFQGSVLLSLGNCLLFITMELSQRVVPNLCIHCRMILNLRALLLSKWAFELVWLHGNIVTCVKMPHQIVLGYIRCIAPINLTRKFGPVPCPMDTFYGNWGRGNHIWNQKTKTKNLMWNFIFWMKFIP